MSPEKVQENTTDNMDNTPHSLIHSLEEIALGKQVKAHHEGILH